MADILHGFIPVASRYSRVLLLGTFPGRISREKGQYYGNARNAFWSILSEILRADLTIPDYAEKVKLLEFSGIALWDIVAHCETEGSLDSEIKKESLVDLNAFLQHYPGIRAVFFNGGNAARYAKRLGTLPIPAQTLPSTSPANARMRPGRKLALWREAISPWLGADSDDPNYLLVPENPL